MEWGALRSTNFTVAIKGEQKKFIDLKIPRECPLLLW